MRRAAARATTPAVAIAAALSWVLLDPVPWPARLLAVFLLVALPVLLLLQARLSAGIPEDAEREAVYVSSAVSVWVLAALAMLAARFSGFSRDDLWLRFPGLTTTLAAAAATVAAGLLLMALARLLRLREAPLLHFLLPRTGSEKIAFAGLSVSAGIAEELVFRAFLIAALMAGGAGLEVAVGLSVAVFALSHAYQGILGVLRVALLGGLLTAPMLLTGSVYPSILAHTALDLVAGLLLADWLTGAHDRDH